MIDEIRSNWTQILQHLKNDQDLSDVAFKTWIQNLEVSALRDGVLYLTSPGTEVALDYINRKYAMFLAVSVEEITGIQCRVSVVSPEEEKRAATAFSSTPDLNPLHETLNPKYTFDTFVVGSNNEMAHAASLAVAETPGDMYNPLFIYGGVGLGKTHLLHAIGNFVLKNRPTAKVLYVTSENFLNELVDAIRNKNGISTTEFRNKYRSNDVLLIDDIQFIIGKESMQDEVFHTFDNLYMYKKQIVFSSDRPPKEFATLEDRLRSRFERGLTVDIQSPDFETRMAILRKKEEMEHFQVDNEVIKYIATNIKSNIRELEGALTKVIALSRLTKNKDITVDLAREALKDIISPNADRTITMEDILRVVSDHFAIPREDILSVKRNKEIVMPRQIVMYLCRKLTNSSYQEIGHFLGNRDHTTVIYGEDKIKEEMILHNDLTATVKVIEKKLSPT